MQNLSYGRLGLSATEVRHDERKASPLSDLVMSVLHDALRGLSMRQRATADNIANIQTPGYQAKRVSFEDTLARELNGSGEGAAQFTTSKSNEATRQDGNNVNLDDESVSMEQTQLQYQTMVQALNQKFHVLRSAIGSQP